MKKKNWGPTAQREETGSVVGRSLLAGIVCGVVVFVVLFCIMAAVICQVDVPVALLVPVASFLVCVGVMIAAWVFARLLGRRGLLVGFALGVGLFLLLWAAAWLQHSGTLTENAAFKCLAMGLSGAVGGYAGVLSAQHKKHSRPL